MTSELDKIGSISDLLTSTPNGPVNYKPVMDLISESIGFEKCILLLFDNEFEGLIPEASAGIDPSKFRKLENIAAFNPLKNMIGSTSPIIIKDLAADQHLAFLADSDNEELFAVIVQVAGRITGVFAVITASTKLPLGEVETRLITITASLIGQSLRAERAVLGERSKLIEENSHLRQELKEKYNFGQIIGTSKQIKLVYEQITQVARSNATVLLRGESGTGKEMIANSIHYNSLRSKQPLIKINCAALPDTLIEAELFGYEKGAFTGAERIKKGRFELADGGTLFLDEIGDLSPQTQIKLLRVLQEREFERIGGTETIKTNIRLITATNKNLETAIEQGDFREDLYYRLNVFSIFLPPLRERKSDILLLAEYFLEKYETEHGKHIRRISTPAIDMLTSYHFPGNVRELENAIERAVLVCDSNVIHSHHLPPTLQTAEVTGTLPDQTLTTAVAAFESDMIQDALKSSKGSVAKAARTLGSTERILGYKIKKYNIDPLRFRR